MKIEIEVQENDNRLMIMSEIGGKFEEGDFAGNFVIGGLTMIVNHSDGRQWKIDLRQIIEGIHYNQ